MQINEHDLSTLDQTVEEISSILARGYLHYEKSRPLVTESGSQTANVKQSEDSELFTEKGLDSSGRQSVHAFAG
ncbi:MAG: hypothetical protein HKP58_06845 [Desulfatitalea sp.]|nr:hypothetical protein [Desulfatitalea sp.]NNK00113.1 hypothetical protein [Desulfatitalea sp.]